MVRRIVLVLLGLLLILIAGLAAAILIYRHPTPVGVRAGDRRPACTAASRRGGSFWRSHRVVVLHRLPDGRGWASLRL